VQDTQHLTNRIPVIPLNIIMSQFKEIHIPLYYYSPIWSSVS
jgi:hypothetical protein